ncbi:hypothetical protein FIBSPDRAFT_100888 [Athelia psychrophila]|uniref:Uncharacterized protein n=1 Tax=Athelia psychrophila TaxID=1759441 RepID=A0A166DJW8_9AGAM|nr:hypothetical protein FIBSPDRAFT_100888 [Fibularhizoctonia sp. CBS 109695]
MSPHQPNQRTRTSPPSLYRPRLPNLLHIRSASTGQPLWRCTLCPGTSCIFPLRTAPAQSRSPIQTAPSRTIVSMYTTHFLLQSMRPKPRIAPPDGPPRLARSRFKVGHFRATYGPRRIADLNLFSNRHCPRAHASPPPRNTNRDNGHHSGEMSTKLILAYSREKPGDGTRLFGLSTCCGSCLRTAILFSPGPGPAHPGNATSEPRVEH